MLVKADVCVTFVSVNLRGRIKDDGWFWLDLHFRINSRKISISAKQRHLVVTQINTHISGVLVEGECTPLKSGTANIRER